MTKFKLPSAQDAETCIIGSMLSSINAVNYAIENLTGDEFFYSQNIAIFQAMKRLYKRNQQIDEVILLEELRSTNSLNDAGGIDYILSVSNYAEPYTNIQSYITIVREKYKLRKIIQIGKEAVELSLGNPENVNTLLDTVQKKFHELSMDSLEEFTHIKEIIDGTKTESKKAFIPWIEELQERVNAGLTNESLLSGLTSGFIDLDKLIDGFGNTNLIILAGRPGMGKTTFALNLVLNAVFKANVPVAFFSLEMSGDQIAKKLLFAHSEISESYVKKNQLSSMEFQSLVSSSGFLSQKDLIIEDPPRISIQQLKSRARRLQEVYGIKMLVIDYLQLVVSDQKYPNRQEEVASISKELKGLARELNIPVICLAQLSRKTEERDSKKPVMSDLRESGAIEQDADQILFVNRPDVYDSMNKPGLAEIIVGKNRHGATGTATLAFKSEIGKFYNCLLRPNEMEETSEEDYTLKHFQGLWNDKQGK